MKKYYDLHIHSCLSACADSDMTPNNIAGMAYLNKLDIVALTDHNSSKNCPAFFKAARAYGIVPIAGMELTTAEEIHVVCLFEDLVQALKFEEVIENRRMNIPNKTSIYNEQLVMDENDNVVEIMPNLLSLATSVTIEEAFEEVNKLNGICYPAHIDKNSNSVITMLGDIPSHIPYTCFEFHDKSKIEEYKHTYPIISGKNVVSNSDAHTLGLINERVNCIELFSETEQDLTHELLLHLKQELD